MNHSLNSLKGVIWGTIYGTTIGLIKGDTRSLDNGSYEVVHPQSICIPIITTIQGAGRGPLPQKGSS